MEGSVIRSGLSRKSRTSKIEQERIGPGVHFAEREDESPRSSGECNATALIVGWTLDEVNEPWIGKGLFWELDDEDIMNEDMMKEDIIKSMEGWMIDQNMWKNTVKGVQESQEEWKTATVAGANQIYLEPSVILRHMGKK
uniref:Uncharacterized protein n=1 Tax=Steinernema glaseri TaxID=37863 RepID=A0A1I7ZE48_9BILA